MKYRKKPVVVEAIQWTGDNYIAIDEFIKVPHETYPRSGEVVIPTLEGNHLARSGDYIIKGVHGEFYPCKPDIFAETYEPAATEPKWNELSSNPEQLPKLTAEVFDRPDCPEWAWFATVNKSGSCYIWEHEPCIWGLRELTNHWSTPVGKECKFIRIEGIFFDASDWRNSLIERPTKLPKWCRVGAWIWSDGHYGKITAVTGAKKVVIEFIDDYDPDDDFDYSQARLRPWTLSEAIKVLGAFVVDKSKQEYALISGLDTRVTDGEYHISVATGGEYSASDFVLDYDLLDGSPCGVLERLKNGEWVK